MAQLLGPDDAFRKPLLAELWRCAVVVHGGTGFAALAANVVLYAFIGLLVAKALRSTALPCGVGLLILCGFLFVHRFWSGHLISFILVGLVFAAMLFYIRSLKGQQTA